MLELNNFIIQEDTSVYDAAGAINANGRQIVFVCDGMRLLAVLSDGDLRRYILRSGDISKSVRYAANHSPLTLTIAESHNVKQLLLKNPHIRAIPILDKKGNIVSISFTENTSVRKQTHLGVPVVIMAGGKGTRLAPYTNVLPKPLIPVGDKTITEHIIDRFISFGCDDFKMIINHKKELIKAYFSEVSCNGSLHFIEEKHFQGTGGGLKLLDGIIDKTVFMTNCDILIEADYEDILKHHRSVGATITMVCALKKVSVPYGTIELDEAGRPIKLVEKPEYPILTNTGLYVIEPCFLDNIPPDTYIHITELIQQLMDKGQTVGVYPISESGWLDMGQIDELGKMVDAIN